LMSAALGRLNALIPMQRRQAVAHWNTQPSTPGQAITSPLLQTLVLLYYTVQYCGLVHFPISTQNIFSSTHHIKSIDACMEH
jgi:hypothetical protein